MRPIIVRSDTGLRTSIQIGDHTVITDEPIDAGGMDTGPTPMEMLVGTLGACVVVTTRLYAQRKNWPLEGVTVEVSFERFKREDYPAYGGDSAYVNEFRQRLTFDGPLSDEQRVRLAEIGNRCPVHRTLEYPTIFVDELPRDETLVIGEGRNENTAE